MTAHTTPYEVRSALDDVDFPADKSVLITAAREAHASDEVMKALRGIPPVEYGNRDDVVASVRLDPDSDMPRTAGQKGEQQRRGGKHGLTEHLRDAPKPQVEQEELDR